MSINSWSADAVSLKPLGLLIIVIGLNAYAVLQATEKVAADWMYLSPTGSWVVNSVAASTTQTPLPLPANELSAQNFFWSATNPKGWLQWQAASQDRLLAPGTLVESDSLPGRWQIQRGDTSYLLLQQGEQQRYWPREQWHQLSWHVPAEEPASLMFMQPEPVPAEVFYAWWDPQLTAEVRYRLQEAGRNPMLYQELVISNRSAAAVAVPGYSFAQSSARPPMAAMRALSLEGGSAESAVRAAESQGVPTLTAAEPLQLAPQSLLWLPVSQTPIASLNRQYQLFWDSRQQGPQQAIMNLLLTTEEALPELPGPLAVAIFDNQLPLLNTQYAPSEATRATLNLGRSVLVTMVTEQLRPDRWQLTLVNRSAQAATIVLQLAYWDGEQSQLNQAELRVAADSMSKIELERVGNRIQLSRP